MYLYDGYGLSIASDIELPEMEPAADSPHRSPDITLVAGNVAWSSTKSKRDWFACELRDDGGVYLSWQDVATVYISQSGASIVYRCDPHVEQAVLRQALIGPALACALRNHGLLVLHASSIAIKQDGGACMFLGQSGAGKSTIAAAMCMHGHGLLSDDVVALEVDPDKDTPIRVLGGLSRFKLWKDSVAAIGINVGSLQPIHSQVDKFAFAPGAESRSSNAASASKSLPLHAIFELRIGASITIEHLSGSEALLMMIPNCFVGMLDASLRGKASARELLQCARVVKEVPIAALLRPGDLGALRDTASLIERQVTNDMARREATV